MKKENKHLTAAILLGVSILLGAFIIHAAPQQDDQKGHISYEDLKEQIKSQLLAQMETEIDERVRKEVAHQIAMLEDDQADRLNVTLRSVLQNHHVDQMVRKNESKSSAIQRMVREVKSFGNAEELSDEELDSTVASALNLPTYLPNGYQSTQQKYDQYAQMTTPLNQKRTVKRKQPNNGSSATKKKKKAKAKSIQRTVQQKGGILLKKGTLQVEPSMTYAQFSSNVINVQGFSILPVLVIGQVSTNTIKRNVFIQNLSVKYGLFHNFQVEASVPYRYEHDRETNQSITEEVTDFHGFGDLQLGFSRQILWEKGWLPDTVANISFKTRTGQEPYNNDIGIGTGHYAIRTGLVFVKSSDPAVIFGNINYTHNFKRDNIPNFPEINPGNSMGFSLGTAIALSYQTAINFSYDQGITSKSSRAGQTVPGTFLNTSSIKTGFTWAFNNNTSIDFSVGVGLTSDTPDMSVTLRIPHTF